MTGTRGERREDGSFVVGPGEAVAGELASSRRGFPRRGRGFGLDTHRRVKRAVVGILHRVQELEAREEPLEPLLRDPESLHQTLGREDVKRDVTQAHAAALGDGEHVVLPRLGSDEVYARGRHRHLRTRATGAFTRRFPRARRGDDHTFASVADAGWAIRGSALSQPSPATPPGSRPSRSSASPEYQSTRVQRVTTRRARVTVRPEATRVRRITGTGAAGTKPGRKDDQANIAARACPTSQQQGAASRPPRAQSRAESTVCDSSNSASRFRDPKKCARSRRPSPIQNHHFHNEISNFLSEKVVPSPTPVHP